MGAGRPPKVRERSRDRGEVDQRPVGAGWCTIARRRTNLYLGIGRVNYPPMGDEGEGEKLNNFNEDEY